MRPVAVAGAYGAVTLAQLTAAPSAEVSGPFNFFRADAANTAQWVVRPFAAPSLSLPDPPYYSYSDCLGLHTLDVCLARTPADQGCPRDSHSNAIQIPGQPQG